MIFLAQTDTTAGFLGRDLAALNALKNRSKDQPCVICVGALADLGAFCRVPNKFKKMVRRAKKTTFIYPKIVWNFRANDLGRNFGVGEIGLGARKIGENFSNVGGSKNSDDFGEIGENFNKNSDFGDNSVKFGEYNAKFNKNSNEKFYQMADFGENFCQNQKNKSENYVKFSENFGKKCAKISENKNKAKYNENLRENSVKSGENFSQNFCQNQKNESKNFGKNSVANSEIFSENSNNNQSDFNENQSGEISPKIFKRNAPNIAVRVVFERTHAKFIKQNGSWFFSTSANRHKENFNETWAKNAADIVIGDNFKESAPSKILKISRTKIKKIR